MRHLVFILVIVVAPLFASAEEATVRSVDDLLVPFTILTNDGQDAAVPAALSMLSGAEKR